MKYVRESEIKKLDRKPKEVKLAYFEPGLQDYDARTP
jgi:hypothetical protein